MYSNHIVLRKGVSVMLTKVYILIDREQVEVLLAIKFTTKTNWQNIEDCLNIT